MSQTQQWCFFFDLDNTLYSQSLGISKLMGEKIQDYFTSSLPLDAEDARTLHHRYYKDYGLALQGLIKHHKIDPLHYNAHVDDALPLETILKPDPALRKLLESFDRRKVKLWILTNAYISHAKRALTLLGLDDIFEGITFCDYAKEPLLSKPDKAFFEIAMKEAGVTEKSHCLFVDDSLTNIEGAVRFGFKENIHFKEPLEHPTGAQTVPSDIKYTTIKALQELPSLYPHLFLQSTTLEA
ncbi:HAD-like domain-containing protein [Protomyces lactucae-debilis]|uniref:HAD-like domain-containing protein n=1 Tax=Protomyces lactucae-debilis TaxID=2754530 RepID=A0A1Y2FS35_PROLT|nr:HAD-like domain-containing protein [Protomyces lactucae-debilis]ORY86803.1 HAD-like domain-containing protein [Protomyces lactucae-debilis]